MITIFMVSRSREVDLVQASLTLPEQLTLQHVEFLASCSSDTHVTIWTLQHSEAVAQLYSTGYLTGDSAFTFGAQHTAIGKKSAYAWMQEQLKRRILDYDNELPIWGLLSRPDNAKAHAHDHLVRLEIPRSRMLVSFYQPWRQLLDVMACLASNGGKWPEIWFPPDCPYLFVEETERKRRFVQANRCDPESTWPRWQAPD